MKKTKSNKGCFGRRIKIEPSKSGILGQDDLIQKGKVIGVGPDVKQCKVGDIIIFSTDGFDKVVLSEGEETFYYILETDTFIYEIIS